jgi:hypothetical protein
VRAGDGPFPLPFQSKTYVEGELHLADMHVMGDIASALITTDSEWWKHSLDVGQEKAYRLDYRVKRDAPGVFADGFSKAKTYEFGQD